MAIQKIPNTLIADNAVTAAKIANGSLTADDISNNSITAAKLSVSTSPTFASLTTTGVLNNFSTSSSWGTGLTLTNTNDDASPAILTFKKAPASGHTTMADNDYIGFINFRADNSNNDEHSWVELSVLALDVTDGSEDSAFRITTWGGGTEYTNTLIANGGNVGIGTANPNADLHIGSSAATGDATNPALQIGGASTYRLGMYTGSEDAIIENKNGDDGIAFRVKTAGEAMRIDGGTGNVGIGTSSPAEKLHIFGGGNGPEIRMQNSTSSHYIRAYNDNWNFLANATNTAMTIRNSGQVDFGAGLGIGGTGAANTLDDYEEGTWTGTVTSSTATTVTWGVGNYTKIGNMVYASFRVFVSGQTIGNNYIILYGPFAQHTAAIDWIGYCNNYDSGNRESGIIINNSSGNTNEWFVGWQSTSASSKNIRGLIIYQTS